MGARLARGERVFYAAIPRYSYGGPTQLVPYKIDVYITSASGFTYMPVSNFP